MIKVNLPVIILKGIILLPSSEIRLEFDNTEKQAVIDIAEMFHDGNILIVNQKNHLEEEIDTRDLPKIGVVARIVHKLELPNGKVRVIIKGLKRASVHEYLNSSSEITESILSEINIPLLDIIEEKVIIRKLYNEVEKYIKSVPYISNSVLSQIINITDLSKMTDLIASQIPIPKERKYEYLLEINPSVRAEMILEDIYREEEMFKIEREIDAKVKKDIDENQKEFILREKIKAIREELGETTYKEKELEELQTRIETINAPRNIKDRLRSELKKLKSTSTSSPELTVTRTYIDWLLDLPWENETIDNFDLLDVSKKLDKTHYGLDKVKERIIEYLAVKQKNPKLKSPIICLVGPPGVGKTSLAFSVAEALNRKFSKISVGGVNDEAEIMGHRKTYIGASPGRIIEALKKSGSINPVILIDEIDKMSHDYKGDPASALLSVLDPEQNKIFSDHYIEEEIDLSKVMFITTANYEKQIPEPLKDRLEIINLSGYTEYEKLDIAKKYLLPKININHAIKDEVNITNKIILKIIRNFTKESGVRELERTLSSVVRKVVSKAVINKEKLEKTTITEKKLYEFLGNNRYEFGNKNQINEPGIVNGLAYTDFGGDVLKIETIYYPGNGNLKLTGSLGNVMRESAEVALSYIKANYKKFGIDFKILTQNDIHIHIPDGAIPKEGPSAGVTLTTALISLFTKKCVSSDIAMTGEITLSGRVLAIGGLKEKTIGAHRTGIKKVIIPNDNINDLREIPDEIRKDIVFIYAKTYEDVYKEVFKDIK